MRAKIYLSKVFHPFLFAIYPVLAAYARNIRSVQVEEIIRPMIVLLIITTFVFLALQAFCKDWDRAGLISALLLFVSLYYGYYSRFPPNFNILGLQVSRHLILMGFWFIFIALVTHINIWRRVRPFMVTRYLNLLAVISFIFPFRIIFFSGITFNPINDWIPNLDIIKSTAQIENIKTPDIYYIILDGYGRADMLRDVYGFDNSNFIDFLRERNFYVADQAHSNYLQTVFSLPSALNMTYFDFLEQFSGDSTNNRQPLHLLLLENRVFEFLYTQNYRIVTFETGFQPTQIIDVDLYLDPQLTPYSSFEELLLQTSVAWIPFELSQSNSNEILPGYDAHRQRILYQVNELPNLAELPGPTFVFLHILAPHPPFVFNAQGEEIMPSGVYTLLDGSNYQGTREEYLTSYIAQLEYLNQLTQMMIDQLLENSEQPPVILLQGDHGPGAYLNWNSVEQSCIYERSSILSAYYLPSEGENRLYPSITPVNSFRLVLDAYFGTELGFLEDKTLASPSYMQPYLFSDVTDRRAEPCK